VAAAEAARLGPVLGEAAAPHLPPVSGRRFPAAGTEAPTAWSECVAFLRAVRGSLAVGAAAGASGRHVVLPDPAL